MQEFSLSSTDPCRLYDSLPISSLCVMLPWACSQSFQDETHDSLVAERKRSPRREEEREDLKFPPSPKSTRHDEAKQATGTGQARHEEGIARCRAPSGWARVGRARARQRRRRRARRLLFARPHLITSRPRYTARDLITSRSSFRGRKHHDLHLRFYLVPKIDTRQ